MSKTLAVGETAPAFTLPNSEGLPVSLADFAPGRVIVYFYPAALTPGCTTQAIDFTTHLKDLTAAGLHVIGISPDAPSKLARFRDQENIGFPLLSDSDRSVLEAYGAYGTKQLYGKPVTGVLRSTFVVDLDDEGTGTIDVAQYNVRAKGHVAKLLRDLGI